MSAVFNKLFATWHVDKVKEYMDAVMSAYDNICDAYDNMERKGKEYMDAVMSAYDNICDTRPPSPFPWFFFSGLPCRCPIIPRIKII